jgi:CRISPR-associated endonuclease Csn1
VKIEGGVISMATRLGLQIGPNSIGWCLYLLDGLGNPVGIQDMGVRIFSNGRDAKTGESLAVARREARAVRRRRDRYVRRRSALLEALVETGLMPYDSEDARVLVGYDPYVLRAAAIDGPIDPPLLGRVLFHLNQRRGFKFNRKAESSEENDKEGGKIIRGSKALNLAMGGQTYGQFLNNQPVKRVRKRSEDDEYDFYPERHHLEAEFDLIWAVQASHNPTVFTEAVRYRLRRIIFFQRPIKMSMAGRCKFFNEETRLPRAHPLCQERRLYEMVNQLKIIKMGAPQRSLTLDERDMVIFKLKAATTVSLAALSKLLNLADGESFNVTRQSRTRHVGYELLASFSNKNCFGERWRRFDDKTRWSIIEAVAEVEDPVRLQDWLMLVYGVTASQAEAIGRVRLKKGYDRLGETACKKILIELKRNVVSFDLAAATAIGKTFNDTRFGAPLDNLPYYGEIIYHNISPGDLCPIHLENKENPNLSKYWGKINNPSLHIGLNQLRRLINALIKVYGRPDQIIIKLAQDLKSNASEKAEHKKRIRTNIRTAEELSKTLIANGQRDSGINRALLKLWVGLNQHNHLDRCCPFCGLHIDQSSLFTDEIEIAHIIPFSRSFDDSEVNRIIAHRICNREKGNKTPWEAWGHTERWVVITERVSRLNKARQWRFAPDAITFFERKANYITRELTDAHYFSQMVRNYLSCLYPDDSSVFVIYGRMIAICRRLWGLNELLPDHSYVENRHSEAPSNRLDHRHHAIDAAVVGVMTYNLLNTISNATINVGKDSFAKTLLDMPKPWDKFRENLHFSVNSVFVSHKAEHSAKRVPTDGFHTTSGKLHNDTAYGLTEKVNDKGRPIVVHRMPLLSLKPADIMNPTLILDEVLQRSLRAATKGLSGKNFEAALLRFSKSGSEFSGIRRVRLRRVLSVISIKDKQGRPYKGYLGDSNALFNVWQLPDGKWLSQTITTFALNQHDYTESRPHPAAKKVLSLCQNDLIAVEKNGAPRQIMRVKHFGQNGQIFLVEHQEAGNLDKRNMNEKDPLKIFGPAVSSLKAMNARQIRINEIGRIFDPGPLK